MIGAWAAALLLPSWAMAAVPTSYALLVGSNRPGPGQQPLQHAIADAERMGTVLTELGDYPPGQVTLLAEPSAQALLSALDTLEGRLRAHAARDEDVTVLFYYSGHARASGLSLGAEEVPLSALRERLDALPAAVRIVVLDACQSGALTQPRGAAPAADFSYSSLQTLQTQGTVILASSSAQELSQESSQLGGGFFTHHLVTGLRGAADRNQDGQVDLAEAYDYAYRTTLQSTTATAIGGQHPTIQRTLQGQGELVLTRPLRASARLALPEDLAGELLVSHAASGAIAAEIHKAAGERVQVALPAGSYAVLLREVGVREAQGCPLNLPEDSTTTWDGRGCWRIAPATVATRGEEGGRLERIERLHLEAGVGYLFSAETAYTDRLDDFGFSGGVTATHWTLSASLGLRGPLSLVISGGILEYAAFSREYSTSEATTTDRFGWETGRLSLAPRASLPLLQGWLTPYAQAGIGLAWARSTLQLHDEDPLQEGHGGPLFSTAGGLQLMPPRRPFGLFLQGEYTHAPTLHNLLGDAHTSGGPALSLGLRIGR